MQIAPTTPVIIMMTGFADIVDAEKPVDFIISKPITLTKQREALSIVPIS